MTPGSIRVDVDPADLDVGVVHRWLAEEAYWALGRPRAVVERAVRGSVNLAAHLDGAFVGYARLVTDRATFAWLCDVYVTRPARGFGVGVALVDEVVVLTEGWGVRRTLLKTGDAHGLYARVGFEVVDDAGAWMIRSTDGPR